MDVYKLNQSTYLPTGNGPIETLDTSIWTERYEACGDFKLTSSLVEETMALLPEMTLLSINGSTEVMMVETHDIKKNDDGDYYLTTSGRSVEAFAEQRWLESPYGKLYRMPTTYMAHEVVLVLLWNAFVNPTEKDITHSIDWFRFSTDKLPNAVVTDSTTFDSPEGRRWLKPGQMYPELIRFLHARRRGIRTIRPTDTSSPAQILTVGSNFPGSLSYTFERTDALRFDVYHGYDRSLEQDTREPVIFRDDAGDLEDVSYTFSIKDRKTVATIASEGFDNGGIKIWDESLGSDQGAHASGWQRRALWIDGGTHDPGDGTLSEWIEDVVSIGQAELAKHPLLRVVDGKVSPTAEYKYGEHYGLGDFVTLYGKFGVQQKMRVTEYIRAYDKEHGDTAYPGLEIATAT